MDGEMLDEDKPPFVAIGGPAHEPVNTAIIAEKTVVLEDFTSFPHAVMHFVAFIYAVNLQFPGKYTYEFMQKILLDIESSKLTPRMQSMKSLLFQLAP